MGDDNTQLAGLLLGMERGIREDIKDCKTDLSARIDDVRADVGALDQRMTAIEQGNGIGLTKKQKAALWTMLSGIALEVFRHLGGWMAAAIGAVFKGAQKL